MHCETENKPLFLPSCVALVIMTMRQNRRRIATLHEILEEVNASYGKNYDEMAMSRILMYMSKRKLGAHDGECNWFVTTEGERTLLQYIRERPELFELRMKT